MDAKRFDTLNAEGLAEANIILDRKIAEGIAACESVLSRDHTTEGSNESVYSPYVRKILESVASVLRTVTKAPAFTESPEFEKVRAKMSLLKTTLAIADACQTLDGLSDPTHYPKVRERMKEREMFTQIEVLALLQNIKDGGLDAKTH